jgi:hypothetical protein
MQAVADATLRLDGTPSTTLRLLRKLNAALRGRPEDDVDEPEIPPVVTEREAAEGDAQDAKGPGQADRCSPSAR